MRILENNEEYVKRIGQLYERVLSLRDDDDYVINQPQMDKLIEVLDFFLDAAKKSEGASVEPVALVPREEHGAVTAYFIVFDIYGEDIARFSDIVRHTSSFGIDTTTDGTACISMTIPEVFVPIQK